MEMNQFLASAFQYNDGAFRKLLLKVEGLQDQSECIHLLSHLINSQRKWMMRIVNNEASIQMSWWDPVYNMNSIEKNWNESVNEWIQFILSSTDERLNEFIQYTGFDGGRWEAKLQDIALQLNYHSIHHRAQIQKIIRQQGLTPEFLDYIGTVYRKIS